jgi:hypothetical protein
MNLDPFNEFSYHEKRLTHQFKKLKEIRHLIDPRVSDSEIRMLIDMGFDVVSMCAEKIKEYEKSQKSIESYE